MAQLAALPMVPTIILTLMAAGFAAMLIWSESVLLLATFFIVVCLCMMIMILIQRPRGGGLSGAFGGAGGGGAQSAFGARAGDMATWVTVVLFLAFLSLAVKLTFETRPDVSLDEPAGEVEPADAGAPLPIETAAPPAPDENEQELPAQEVPAEAADTEPAPEPEPATGDPGSEQGDDPEGGEG